MPRYFFHVRDSEDIPDEVGTDLLDDSAAMAEAIMLAGELLRDLGGGFWSGDHWLLSVVTGDGREVCELNISAKAAEARQ
jgi:hypothetical protein